MYLILIKGGIHMTAFIFANYIQVIAAHNKAKSKEQEAEDVKYQGILGKKRLE
jgi:hypothetical protein